MQHIFCIRSDANDCHCMPSDRTVTHSIGPTHSREWGITIQKKYIGFYFTLLNCLLIMLRRVLAFCKL